MLSRLKFEVKPLVNEILDRLPADVWTRTDTTFLDPAMAGGQFIVEIIARLTSAGHSEDNIASRVFGLASTPLSLMFTQNTHKIRGQFSVGGIETLEQWVMASKKFDVVIGNPPYQSTGDNSKRKKLWVMISNIALKLVKQDTGIVAFVTPQTWQKESKYFADLQTSIKNNIVAIGDANSYFTGIGEDIGWWVYSNNPTAPKIDLGIGTSLADLIYNKVKKHTSSAWHYRDFASFKQCKQYTLTEERSITNTVPVYWTAKQELFAEPSKVKYSGWKVIVNNSGHYPSSVHDKYISINNTHAVGLGAWGIAVANKKEGECVASWVTSKLYRYVVTVKKTGGFNNPFIELQYMGHHRIWTDAELYAHFNLTQEEIDLIEATVK